MTELTATGTYHDPSDLMVFPVQREGWVRGKILRYEVTPGGVSVAYRFVARGSASPGIATAYVYPRASVESLEGYMSETVEQLLSGLPGSVLVSDEAAEFGRATEVFDARMATLLQRAQGPAGPLIHYVILSDQGPWWLKWRITHPAADESVPNAADRLVGSLLPKERTK